MNTKLLTIFIFLLFSGTALCQFSIEFQAGLNHATCKFQEHAINSDHVQRGYFVGFSPRYKINEKFDFVGNFQFSQKGFWYAKNDETLDMQHRYSYIDLIPEIEYSLFKFLKIGAGINVAHIIKTETKRPNENWQDSGIFLIKKADLGWTSKIVGTYENFSCFIRYNSGLTNISHFRLSNFHRKNRNLQIGMGYTIEFNKLFPN